MFFDLGGFVFEEHAGFPFKGQKDLKFYFRVNRPCPEDTTRNENSLISLLFERVTTVLRSLKESLPVDWGCNFGFNVF
jgi:hypothetical protein